MSIKDILNKCKDSTRILEQRDVFVVLLIILASFASFGLGRLSALQEKKTPIRIEQAAAAVMSGGALDVVAAIPARQDLAESEKQTQEKTLASGGNFVGSKNGTTYHFPWCSGATRIKEENKVWFATKEAAERAGYHPAGNCKGL
ncbi:MAG: hypothetical protein HYT28_01825 [Parcubacteria group bacterium]|nr:hypothetical protein [Parcubacteria group bacterium]